MAQNQDRECFDQTQEDNSQLSLSQQPSSVPIMSPKARHSIMDLPALGRGMKRDRDADSIDNGNQSKRPRSNASIAPRRQPTESGPRMACPFVLRDPILHPQCFLYFLANMKDVCQHLSRCHTPPVHCERCGVEFPGDETKASENRYTHLRGEDCNKTKFPEKPGVSKKVMSEIRKACKGKVDDTAKWIQTFEILFPGQGPETPCPWVGPPQIEMPRLCFRAWFAASHLTNVIRTTLDEPSARDSDVMVLSQKLSTNIFHEYESWLKSKADDEEPGHMATHLEPPEAPISWTEPVFSNDGQSTLQDAHHGNWHEFAASFMPGGSTTAPIPAYLTGDPGEDTSTIYHL